MATSEKKFVLVIGDLHIPDRAFGLPESFKELLVPGVISHVICTGNVGDAKTLETLRAISDNFIMVRGDCDEIVPWEDEEALKMYQRELGCDILVHGNSHKFSIKRIGESYFINPGSATGAYSLMESTSEPSFILIGFTTDRSGVFYEYKIDPASQKAKPNKIPFDLNEAPQP